MKNILKAKKENANKGFTLVELIIVVAVIAILATVLAPQYIRYVERSRESNDLQVATTITRAATVAAADPQLDLPANATFTVTWTTSTDAPELSVDGGTDDENKEMLDSISSVLGWVTTAGVYDKTQVDDAQSAVGSGENFVFEIAIATGRIEVQVGTTGGTATTSGWVTDIGVDSAA